MFDKNKICISRESEINKHCRRKISEEIRLNEMSKTEPLALAHCQKSGRTFKYSEQASGESPPRN